MTPLPKVNDQKILEAIANRHPGHRQKLTLLTLSLETQLCPRTVKYAVKRLEALQLITRTRKHRGIPYDYELARSEKGA